MAKIKTMKIYANDKKLFLNLVPKYGKEKEADIFNRLLKEYQEMKK
jgi:hypothetical protein